MIVAIHQPNFVPWLGYFYKMLRCDVFILLDDAQYTKNSFINRNRIKTPQGESWLTIPAAPRLGTPIREVEIKDVSWPIRLGKTLKANYGRAKYFGEVSELLDKALQANPERICETNVGLINLVASWLDLPCAIVRASDYPSSAASDKRLVDLVNAVGGRTYLSGFGGRKYQSEATFTAAGIDCRYYDFAPPVYPQLWGDFIPGLSVLDCLFNCGNKEAARLLRASGTQSS